MTNSCSTKSWIIATLAVAVAFYLMDALFHGMVMMNTYSATAQLWRPMDEMRQLMWVGILGYLAFSALFYLIFSCGFTPGKSKAGQGLRYGLLIGLLFWGAHALMSYPYMPIPSHIYWAWFGIGMIEFAVLGLITGMIYKTR